MSGDPVRGHRASTEEQAFASDEPSVLDEEAPIERRVPPWAIPYFALCFFAQIWPLAGVANRIEPRILGLPFFLFWYVLWVLLIFLGVTLLYRRSRAEERRSQAARPGRTSDPADEGGREG